MTTAVGRSKWELDTPALCVELPVMEQNIKTMSDTIIKKNGVGWRPHTKGQKIPAVAHMELAAGALGVTCAKLGEAEVMAGAGIKDILVANQIVGCDKVTRLANLRRHADVMVAIDSFENASQISKAAEATGIPIRVLLELDLGMHRAGTLPGEATLALATRVASLPGIVLSGVMGWEAHAIAIADQNEKRKVVTEAVGSLVATAELCRANGLAVPIVSCGGTGTYWISSTVPGVTEIQAGGGIFHDLLYNDVFKVPHAFALTVLTTVTSRPAPNRIIVDAGKKAMSSDAVPPRPLNVGSVERVSLSAEHGRIELNEPNHDLKVGDKVEWVVGYSDTTVFLHDDMFATRCGNVEQVWPILGRGKLR